MAAKTSVSKASIQKNLIQINDLYKNATSQTKAQFYSKLAILELCGWIEESMDNIVSSCAKQHLEDSDNVEFVEEEIVRPTYGFKYGKHFRNMLIRTMGIINVERLERRLDKVKFHIMKSALGTLEQTRDRQAHTHIKGTTKRLAAPSVTQSQFQKVYDGLKDVEDCIRKMKI